MSILGFFGPHRWLSNFATAIVYMDGKPYSSVEHAYQAAKTLDPDERERIRQLPTPSAAKHAGKKVTMRTDWEDVKTSVMRELLCQKFAQPPYTQLLLDTGQVYIEETNTWRDTFWGVCNGQGRNELGKLIMDIRDALREDHA